MSEGLSGLTKEDARRALEEHGPNALPEPKRPSLARRLVRQFQSALIYLLLLALTFDLGVWLYQGGDSIPVEGLAILAVLLLNAGLGLLQEYRSEHALEQLRDLSAPRVWVVREGELEQVDAKALVPRDLVRLGAGDRVPADGVSETAESVSVDESMLTGESLPVEKAAGDELFSGTLVMRGRALLRVTRTGAQSTMGRLAGSLATIEHGKTPLEQRVDRLGSRVAHLVALLSVLLLVSGFFTEGVARMPAVVMFAVAFGVAVVPEGMPAMMTLALAFGVQRMAKRHAVIRRLAAVEALGSVTVIASDKTGTLTHNKMTVESLQAEDDSAALLAMVLANDAEHASEIGDPLERSLLEFAGSRGADIHALRTAHPRVSSKPFDSRWKFMRSTVVTPSGERVSYLKGALEVILERSLLKPELRAAWQLKADAEAKRGFKVLGLGVGSGDQDEHLRFLGFVTLWDPPRKEASAAVRAAQQAGITVLMITGDHSTTACAIAERVGIHSARVLTGAEVEQLSDAELDRALSETRVFSRMLPEQKLRIVSALQKRGEVVAMTGDGLNDAPALKQADVGVAMGQRGSDVAREVADVVLLDDNFATIVAAIEEGRSIYENIQNFIRFTFSSNVALMLIVLGGAVGSLFFELRAADGSLLMPLTALQILWINFLGDGPPALALSADRNPGVMRQRPYSKDASLVDVHSLGFILIDGTCKGAVGLALLLVLPKLGLSLATTATSVFAYESIAKLITVFPARRIGPVPQRNVFLFASIAAGLALILACFAVPLLRDVLRLSPLTSLAVVSIAGATLLTWTTGSVLARVLRARIRAQDLRAPATT